MFKRSLLIFCCVLLFTASLGKKLQAITIDGTGIANSATLYAFAGMYVVNSNLVTTLVAAIHGLDLNINAPVTILPMQTAYLPKTLINLGNATENVTMELYNVGEAFWTSQLILDDNQDGVHQAGETTPIALTQAIPGGEILHFFLAISPTTINAVKADIELNVTASAISLGQYLGDNGISYGGPAAVSALHQVLIDNGTGPVVADIKFDDVLVVNGDYIGSLPLITARILDADGVMPGSVTLNIDGLPANGVMTFDGVNLSIQLANALGVGAHIFRFSASDIFGNSSTRNLTAQITNKSMIIGKVLPYPNPCNPNEGDVKITYQLTTDTELCIYIHNITGERIWMSKIEKGQVGGNAGYNEVLWNGETGFNEAVGNGVYLVHIVDSKGKLMAKSKILVIRK